MAQVIKTVIVLLIFNFPLLGAQIEKTFAYYLEKNGDTKNAIVEYERLLVDSSSMYNTDSIHLRIAKLYMKSGLFEKANRELGYLPETEYIDNLKGISYIFSGEYGKARRCISNDTLIGISYLMQGEYGLANNYISLDSLPGRKHPVLGAVLSGIIPGSGKFYAGRAFDGVYSFILTLSPAISSYYYFHKGNKTFGYIYGVIGGFLYLGNIYGSFKACEIYNNYQYDNFRRKELVKFQFTKWF